MNYSEGIVTKGDILNAEIAEYVERVVRPQYMMHDRCHDVAHFDEVYNAMYKMVKSNWADENLTRHEKVEMLLVAAYHDVGRVICPSNTPVHHGVASTYVLKNDVGLRRVLTQAGEDVDMKEICRVIAGHGTHANATDIDEKILMIKDADRASYLDKNRSIDRWLFYHVDVLHEIGFGLEAMCENCFNHLQQTPKKDGYNPKSKAAKEVFPLTTKPLTLDDFVNRAKQLAETGELFN